MRMNGLRRNYDAQSLKSWYQKKENDPDKQGDWSEAIRSFAGCF
jgi:hypothetical protein